MHVFHDFSLRQYIWLEVVYFWTEIDGATIGKLDTITPVLTRNILELHFDLRKTSERGAVYSWRTTSKSGFYETIFHSLQTAATLSY